MHILGTRGSLRRSGIDLLSARIKSILILQHIHCMMKPPVLIRIHHKLVIGVHHTSMRLEVAKQLLHSNRTILGVILQYLGTDLATVNSALRAK